MTERPAELGANLRDHLASDTIRDPRLGDLELPGKLQLISRDERTSAPNQTSP